MSTPLTDAINALTTYANSITGKSDTNLPDAVQSLADGYGQGGGGGMTATGTIVGNGANVLQIPCDFEPDLIYINGDLSANVANRGIVALTILKDMAVYIGLDSSTSASVINFDAELNITGYNTDTSSPYATYSNNVLSIDTVINSGSYRWTSGITYSYKLIKFG